MLSATLTAYSKQHIYHDNITEQSAICDVYSDSKHRMVPKHLLSSIITFAFTALALFLLVFWWFYIMDRIAREYSTKVVIFNCWNTICAVLLSIAFFLCVISYALYQLDRRPIYTPSSLLDRFSVCFNVTIVVFILAVIGIVYRVIQVVRSW